MPNGQRLLTPVRTTLAGLLLLLLQVAVLLLQLLGSTARVVEAGWYMPTQMHLLTCRNGRTLVRAFQLGVL